MFFIFLYIILIFDGFYDLSLGKTSFSDIIYTLVGISFFVAIPFYLFLKEYWRTQNTELIISDERVLFKSQIASEKKQEIKLKNIQNIELTKGKLQKYLDIGDIYITSRRGIDLNSAGFKKPLQLAKLIDDAIDSANSKLARNENNSRLVEVENRKELAGEFLEASDT
jgi:uncharacterized membrane protein YdbT with pleckstrin-like domain